MSRDTGCDNKTRTEVTEHREAWQDARIAAKPHRGARGRKCTFLGGGGGGGEIDSERENFLARDTALYGYAALQPRGFAALHGLVQRLRPVGPNGGAASDGAMASGLWGCSERAPLQTQASLRIKIILLYKPLSQQTGSDW